MEGLDRLKQATRWMWSLGDYAAVAKLLEPYARDLAARCAIRTGTEVLDVAAGNGNFAAAAAGLGANVTASDYSSRMLALGRERLPSIRWVEGDAEDLPFPNGRFDIVGSVFGAMFAPRPELAALEMLRVCRPGGLVGMANYGWQGFLGDYAKLLARYSNPSPVPLPQPFDWGDPEIARERLSRLAASVEVQSETLTIEADFEFWERTNGPTIALRQMLPPERYAEFRRDAAELMKKPELTSAYLVVLARK